MKNENQIEGRNAVLEAFRSGKTIDRLYILDGCQDGPVRTIAREAGKRDTIINYVKKKYNLLIGERTAEDVKIKIGSAYAYEGEEPMEIKGRNLVDGLPKNLFITPAEIREALADPIASVLEAIRITLEKTPPELSADIIDHGIILTGGGALLKGLDVLISQETGMPAYIAENPLDCVAAGTGKVLEDIDRLREVLSDDTPKY